MKLQLNKFHLMFNPKTEKIFLFILLGMGGGFLFYVCYSAEGTFDFGDGIRHYLMSRYSWKYPALLLDLWAKPLFTFLSSPFAQFGLVGMSAFQILCATATSFFCFKLAKRFEIENRIIVPVLICFTPIYFPIINSGLTEIFFGFMIVLSIYLMVEKKYIWSAIAVSFLPFARNEGYLFFPLFGLALLYRKQYLSVLFLLTGTLFLSFIGYFVFNNITWLFANNPYKGAQDIYGHGELLSFVKQYDIIFGLPLTLLIVAGLLWAITKFSSFKKIISPSTFYMEEFFLIYGCALVYFIGHSIFWWKGLFCSLGMIRMMAAIIPMAALISLRGLNWVFLPLKKYSFVISAVILLLSAWMIRTAFHQSYFPFRFGAEEKVAHAAAEWLKKSDVEKGKLYYSSHFFIPELNVDPFDKNLADECMYVNKEHFTDNIEDKSIIIWDAHYAPNEGHLPLDTLLGNPHFELLQAFVPAQPFTVLGGYNYEIYIFQKHNIPIVRDTNALQADTLEIELFDFETPDKLMAPKMLSTENFYSGKQSVKSTPDTEYGPGIQKYFSEINKMKSLKEIGLELKLYPYGELKDALCVMEVRDSTDKQLDWQPRKIIFDINDTTKWKTFSCNFFINPTFLMKGNYLKLYVWNHGKNNFFTDDMKISYLKNDLDKIIVQ